MAQEFIPIAENEISALTPDRTPAKVRGIDDQGNSVNLTPAQTSALVLTDANKPRIQELAGIDYSLLTEQVVPGEWYMSRDGKRCQMYTNTKIMMLPTTMPPYSAIAIFPSGTARSINSITAHVYIGGNWWLMNTGRFLVEQNSTITLDLNGASTYLGCQILVSAKYAR